MSNGKKFSGVIAEAKAVDDELRAQQDRQNAALKDQNRIEQERKRLFAGDVNHRLNQSVKDANSELTQANLPTIKLEVTQGIPEFSLHFTIEDKRRAASLLAIASLSGDSIVVKYLRLESSTARGHGTYDLASVDTDELVHGVIKAYVELQKSIA